LDNWFLFGIPGFGSVMIILWLMIAKPFQGIQEQRRRRWPTNAVAIRWLIALADNS
jgi:hypothetical protein